MAIITPQKTMGIAGLCIGIFIIFLALGLYFRNTKVAITPEQHQDDMKKGMIFYYIAIAGVVAGGIAIYAGLRNQTSGPQYYYF